MENVVSRPNAVTASLIAGCINENPLSGVLIQAVRNKAAEWNVPWAVIYVETPEHYDLTEEEKEDVIRSLSRAEQMGARVYHFISGSVTEGLLEFVTKNGVSDIFIGRSKKAEHPLLKFFSLSHKLSRYKNIVNTHVVKLSYTGKDSKGLSFFISALRIRWRNYAYSLAVVGATTLFTEILYEIFLAQQERFSTYNVYMIFMLAAIINALRFGFLPATFSTVVSAGVITFLYVTPRFALGEVIYQDYLSLFFFLALSIIACRIGGIIHNERRISRKRQEKVGILYNLTKSLVNNPNPKNLKATLESELRKILETETYIFLVKEQDLETLVKSINFLSQADIAALEYCWKNQQASGSGTFQNIDSTYHFEPMMASYRLIGVVAVKFTAETGKDLSYIRLTSILADQAALALERGDLLSDMEENRLREEREKLRSALLSSISHDLKTPLASIIGSLSAVRHMKANLTQAAHDTLVNTALDEAERLNSFITNILNMTRLESGAIKVKKVWIDPDNLVGDLLRRNQQRFIDHKIMHQKMEQPIEVELDAALFELLFYNLLDNATKYSPPGSDIIIRSESCSENGKPVWKLSVIDQGPGIEEKDRVRVFNKFTRLEKKDHQIAGTGLGLAICKAIADVHDGSISIENNFKDGVVSGGIAFVVVFNAVRVIAKNSAKKLETTSQN